MSADFAPKCGARIPSGDPDGSAQPEDRAFFLAFLSQSVVIADGHVIAQLTILGMIFAPIGFTSTILYSGAAGGLCNILRCHPIVLRWQSKVGGAIYCALGARLALQEQ